MAEMSTITEDISVKINHFEVWFANSNPSFIEDHTPAYVIRMWEDYKCMKEKEETCKKSQITIEEGIKHLEEDNLWPPNKKE